MNLKQVFKSICSPRHLGTRGKYCYKWMEFGLPSTIFVYNDAAGHMTQFWPPDWLLLCTSSIPWHRRDSQFTWFPAQQRMATEAL